MELTPANLNYFFTNLSLQYQAAYSGTPTFYDKLCTTVTTQSEQMVFGWIGKLNKMREWVGSRVTNQPAPQTYILTPQLFELTETIDKFKLMDDQYGIYGATATFMGEQARKAPDYQLRDLLQNTGSQTGARQLCSDGLSFFNTAHLTNVWDASSATYCNDFSGGVSVGGITVGGALTPQGYSTLRQEMMSRKGENGEPLGVTPNLLVVPPQLEGAAQNILKADYMSPATYANTGNGTNVGVTQNLYKGSAEMLVIPELAAAPTTWYLLDTTKAVKPFVHLQRQAPNFVYRIQEQDPVVFDQHRYVYGVDARFSVGWSFPWLASKSAP